MRRPTALPPIGGEEQPIGGEEQPIGGEESRSPRTSEAVLAVELGGVL